MHSTNEDLSRSLAGAAVRSEKTGPAGTPPPGAWADGRALRDTCVASSSESRGMPETADPRAEAVGSKVCEGEESGDTVHALSVRRGPISDNQLLAGTGTSMIKAAMSSGASHDGLCRLWGDEVSNASCSEVSASLVGQSETAEALSLRDGDKGDTWRAT